MTEKNPTVSVVIACYNKEKYIGELLDSILSQTYRRLEVIVVDDGSTDKTAAILESYQERFAAAGMDYHIKTQENMGVAIAVRNGLLVAQGDFICMPDADDTYMPEFVESMLSQMKEDVDWVVCDSDRTRWTQCYDEYTDDACTVQDRFEDLLERYILMCNYGMAWQLLIRTSYLKRMDIIGALGLLGWTTTHEAPVWIPLIAGHGKGTYLPKALYIFRDTIGSLSNPGSIEKTLAYAGKYKDSINIVLDFCHITNPKYKFLAAIREYQELLSHAPQLVEYVSRELSDVLLRSGHIGEALNSEAILIEGNNPTYCFSYWLWWGFVSHFAPAPTGDVIAYGVLGQRGMSRLPLWQGSRWKPDRLWDKNGAGIEVEKPDYASLKAGDTIVVFPKDAAVLREVQEETLGMEVRVISPQEADMIFAKQRFMEYPMWKKSYIFSIT